MDLTEQPTRIFDELRGGNYRSVNNSSWGTGNVAKNGVLPSIRHSLADPSAEHIAGRGISDVCHSADPLPIMRVLKLSSVSQLSENISMTRDIGSSTGAVSNLVPKLVDLLFRALPKVSIFFPLRETQDTSAEKDDSHPRQSRSASASASASRSSQRIVALRGWSNDLNSHLATCKVQIALMKMDRRNVVSAEKYTRRLPPSSLAHPCHLYSIVILRVFCLFCCCLRIYPLRRCVSRS